MALSPATLELFRVMVDIVRADQPGFHAILKPGKAADFRKPRDFAFCEVTAQPPYVVRVRPDFSQQPAKRQAGLLAHELGHASLLFQGRMNHAERAADWEGTRLFGQPIRYGDLDVQTWGTGKDKRPGYLPR